MHHLAHDLSRLVISVAEDLRGAVAASEAEVSLRHEFARESTDASATRAESRDRLVTQAAMCWVLGTLLVRFCEDNNVVVQSRAIAGPTRESILTAERAQIRWMESNPGKTSREWLLSALAPIAAVFPEGPSNPFTGLPVSSETADRLLQFWRDVDQDLTDSHLDTTWLEEFYTNLSESEFKSYVLLPTPKFIVSYVLDQTLTPAISEFGLPGLRLVNPACGSGGFLLAAFDRLVRAWDGVAPGGHREWLPHVLNALHGVDLHPVAVAVSRFRLLVAAYSVGKPHQSGMLAGEWLKNIRLADALLPEGVPEPGSYHVAVCEPPYVSVRDRELDKEYRLLFPVCSGAYSLVVPFTVRLFNLIRRAGEDGSGAGRVGLMASNSFMKREFGRKLIEEFLAKAVTVTDIVDSSGAYIPGRATPTVIMFGRNRAPRDSERTTLVIATRGEPELPGCPENGRVWQSILQTTQAVGTRDEWTSSYDVDYHELQSFPWNLTSPTASRIIRTMTGGELLGEHVLRIGYDAATGADALFTAPLRTFRRFGVYESDHLVPILTGSEVRDWTAVPELHAFSPRDQIQAKLVDIRDSPRLLRRLWPFRSTLGARPNFSGKTYWQAGRVWYEWHQIADRRNQHKWRIVYSWVTTHNQFSLVRGNEISLNSAPSITLPDTAGTDIFVNLTALLNSSLACFWLKHHNHSKGHAAANTTGTGEPWTQIYEFAGSRLRELPLPRRLATRHAEEIDELASKVTEYSPATVLAAGPPVAERLREARKRWESTWARMVALQEELDWEIYRSYGLLHDDDLLAPAGSIPDLVRGERAFEIVLARTPGRTTWFERHHITSVVDLPDHWADDYREVVARRINAIKRSPEIREVERPEFKRRWTVPSWKRLESAALREWILNRCESPELWFAGAVGSKRPRPLSIIQLAELLGADPDFRAVAAQYEPGKSPVDVVASCVEDEHVPYLTAMRFRESGLRKHAEWRRTWDLQSVEDNNGHLGMKTDAAHPPAPPTYTSADYHRPSYWRLRGKLDNRGERFVSYPRRFPRDGNDLPLGWAGWDDNHRAEVLVDLILSSPGSGPTDQELVPLLAGLHELLPWITRWTIGLPTPASPNTDYEAFMWQRMTEANVTTEDLSNWRLPQSGRGRPRKA